MTKHRGFGHRHSGRGGFCVILAAGVAQLCIASVAAVTVATIGQGPIRNMLPPTRDRELLAPAPEGAVPPFESEGVKRARGPELAAGRTSVAAMDRETDSSGGGAMIAVGVVVATLLGGGGLIWNKRRKM